MGVGGEQLPGRGCVAPWWTGAALALLSQPHDPFCEDPGLGVQPATPFGGKWCVD